MSVSFPLACRCGALRGEVREVSTDTAMHFLCYCDDCQCFAVHLGAAEQVLDESGGTALLPVAPARVWFDDPSKLRCLRLSPKGPLRWYAGCCKTPVANGAASAGLPFISLIRALASATDQELVDAVGAPRGVNGAFATGPTPPGTAPNIPRGLLAKSAARMLAMRLRGLQRPSPFFAAGAPVSEPELLSKEERERLRALVRPR